MALANVNMVNSNLFASLASVIFPGVHSCICGIHINIFSADAEGVILRPQYSRYRTRDMRLHIEVHVGLI